MSIKVKVFLEDKVKNFDKIGSFTIKYLSDLGEDVEYYKDNVLEDDKRVFVVPVCNDVCPQIVKDFLDNDTFDKQKSGLLFVNIQEENVFEPSTVTIKDIESRFPSKLVRDIPVFETQKDLPLQTRDMMIIMKLLTKLHKA